MPRIAIYTLMMEAEFESTKVALQTVLSQTTADRQLFLLLNGSQSRHIRDYFSQYAHVRLFSSPTNLGVAGGRNFLITHAMEWGAEIFFSLDNDILVPEGYFSNVVEKIQAVPGRLGVFVPAVLNYPCCKSFLAIGSQPLFSDQDLRFASEELRSYVKNMEASGQLKVFYHLGVKKWFCHYLTSRQEVLGALAHLVRKLRIAYLPSLLERLREKEVTFLARDPASVKFAVNGNEWLAADCVPGGLHVFHRSLLEEIGLFDESFNPFGYEDAEFCIRARKSDRVNGVLTSIAVIHDIDGRYVERDFGYNMYLRGKAKRLLLLKHVKNPLAIIAGLLDAILIHPLLVSAARARRASRISFFGHSLRSYWRGFFGLQSTNEGASSIAVGGPIRPALRRGMLARLLARLLSSHKVGSS